MDVFVARQPIFDRDRELFGYELLFRSGGTDQAFDGTDSSVATTRLLANSLLAIGLDNLVQGKKAFINFDLELLLGDLPTMFRPDDLVLEVLETVEPDERLVAACRRLRSLGYTIALDDFVADGRFDQLMPLINLIKVDVRVTGKDTQEQLVQAYRTRGIKMLAEKVETLEEFEWTHRAGYDYFQGYFFARPSIVRGQQIQQSKLTCVQLLGELHHEDLDYARVESLIRQDVSLAYTLLRYANSAMFYFREEIQGIRHALVVIGEDNVRHWAALAALPVLTSGKPSELITHALVRARFCELLAEAAAIRESARGFLIGLFSLLDAMLDLPIDTAINQVGLAPDIRDVILGNARQDNRLDSIYRLVLKYQESDWDQVKILAGNLGIRAPEAVARAYTESTQWAHKALSATTQAVRPERETRQNSNMAGSRG